MISVYRNDIDITSIVTSVKTGGASSEAGRTCDVSYVNAPQDPVLKEIPDIILGDYISVVDDEDGELFYGRVTGREKSSEPGSVTANCIDDAQLLLKSSVSYSYTDKTAESIAALILADLEFTAGTLAETGVSISSFVADGISAFEAIKQAYDTAAETTGKTYWIEMQDRALCVVEFGEVSTGYIITEEANITGSSYTESADSIVNRVVILDSDGNRIGQVDDEDSQALYGVYQQLYTEEDGIDSDTAAQNAITGPEQSLSVDVTQGFNAAVAGRSITLYDSATGQSGKYWILNDSHEYVDGQHNMTLELSFQSLIQGE